MRDYINHHTYSMISKWLQIIAIGALFIGVFYWQMRSLLYGHVDLIDTTLVIEMMHQERMDNLKYEADPNDWRRYENGKNDHHCNNNNEENKRDTDHED